MALHELMSSTPVNSFWYTPNISNFDDHKCHYTYRNCNYNYTVVIVISKINFVKKQKQKNGIHAVYLWSVASTGYFNCL